MSERFARKYLAGGSPIGRRVSLTEKYEPARAYEVVVTPAGEQKLKAFETNGNFPALSIICLPSDHTSGTSAGAHTPAAQVADNDLAFGQIVEAISHSRFWPETCILAIEDDPQAGWDP